MCEPDPGLTSLLQTKVEQNGGYIRNSYSIDTVPIVRLYHTQT
jgi:hypothetical protein